MIIEGVFGLLRRRRRRRGGRVDAAAESLRAQRLARHDCRSHDWKIDKWRIDNWGIDNWRVLLREGGEWRCNEHRGQCNDYQVGWLSHHLAHRASLYQIMDQIHDAEVMKVD